MLQTVNRFFLLQILNELQDSAKRDAIVEKLKARVKVLEDEHGETVSVVRFNDAVIGTPMLHENYRHGYGQLHNITQLSIREDDIVVIDDMKSGML